MIILNKHSGYSRDGIRRYYTGGGGGPTSSVTNTSNIPDYLRPQIESLLGGATQELFNTKPNADGTYDIGGLKAFKPFSTNAKDYVAGFTPLQQQVQSGVAGMQMPGQFARATEGAEAAGTSGMLSAIRANDFGTMGNAAGQRGEQLGVQAGGNYGQQGMDAGLQGLRMGMQGGAQYGNMGAQAGITGQDIGIRGGAQYGNMGANAGNLSAQIGQMGLQAQQTGQQIGNQAQNYAAQAAAAGQNYTNQATNPNAVQQYMNPYTQNVVDIQNQAAQRQADIASTLRGSQFARAGAFGGARQAIENAEANRSLQTLMNTNQAQGQQSAYDKAIQSMQYGSNLGLQGLSGAQQGLGTALQGGQLGLSGIGTALQGQQGAMQGAGVGLQGVNAQLAGTAQGMQGAGVGLQGVNTQLAGTAQGMEGAKVGLAGVDRQLAGTAQGMQGAQVGLQGVNAAQAGYSLTNQAAANMANIGSQQLAGQNSIYDMQNQIGAQQQAQNQQVINQDIQNYANTQNNAMDKLQQYNSLLRGYVVPGQTTTQYQAQPTLTNQLTGLGTAAYGVSQLAKKKKGGTVRSGISNLALYNATR